MKSHRHFTILALLKLGNGCRGIMSNRQVIIQIQHDQDSGALVHEAILLQSHLFRGPLGPELLVGIQLIPGDHGEHGDHGDHGDHGEGWRTSHDI